MKLTSFFLFFTLLFAGITNYAQEAAPENTAKPQEDVSTKGYMLGPGDKVAGLVNGEVGYDFVTIVDENGRIYLPFGDKKSIIAQCRTESEVRNDIELEIKKYIREPHLNFRIDEKHRPPVTIYGEINKPSELMLIRKATLVEVLAAAGGAREQEASGLVEVRRPRLPMCMADDDTDNWKTRILTGHSGSPI